MIDYYEFLQISPNADTETIHRVYRFLAGRFHPDNPASGDADLFHLLKTAYDVLSDPDRRDEYNAIRKPDPLEEPLSSSVDFMDNLDGELNRRLALLAVLYHRRRTRPDMPEVPLDEIETRMGFPRDYLDFTMELAGAILAHPGEIEAALTHYEAAMFSRSELAAVKSAQGLEMCFNPTAPKGLVDFFTAMPGPDSP